MRNLKKRILPTLKVNEYAAGIPTVNESGCVKCGGGVGGVGGLSLPVQRSRSGNASSEGGLDLSLCGDPLMYATFVAPVQQYSTETEPSRQPSFNYANSRQPSFKQNSSETEPQAHAPLQPPQGGAPGDHFFPGGLPPPSPDNLLRQDGVDVQGQCGQMRKSSLIHFQHNC